MNTWQPSRLTALTLMIIYCALLFHLSPAHATTTQAEWWPIQVKSYYGPYNTISKKPGHAATCLKGPKLEEWTPPLKANNAYTLGIAFPHMKDSYWLAVNYGIIEEAKRLGVGIKLVEAGGYDELDTQIQQVRTLAKAKVDGIILGAISYEGCDEVIKEITDTGIPVVEVINDVRAQNVSAKALVSFYDMGYYAGEFVAEHAENNGLEDVHVAFLPGPKNSGWAPETLLGFKDALKAILGNVRITDVLWGDTGKETQSKLIRKALENDQKVDYLVGNAIAAEAAPEILTELGRDKSTLVLSTYIIPALYDKIKNGLVAAAPSDLTVFQGRMAVDMLVRTLDGKKPGTDFPFRSGPFIPMVTPDNIDSYPYEGLFGPRNFKPVFNLAPRK